MNSYNYTTTNILGNTKKVSLNSQYVSQLLCNVVIKNGHARQLNIRDHKSRERQWKMIL